jgi:uncharacterized membrane protein (DUF441 family)
MHSGYVVLCIVLAVSLLGGNNLVALAAASALLLQLVPISGLFGFFEHYSSQLGITFLLISFLLPFASGRVGMNIALRSLLTSSGAVAVIIGAISACLAADGVNLLTKQPDIMVGMVLGSVFGVFFMGGIPAGPLVAAGLAAFIFRFIR